MYYIYIFFCQLQKELFGGGEAGQPDGMTSRKMSNGSTGSPKLKWLKAFKSLKTSSPTTPPLSDKWVYFLSINTNFHHVHAAKKCRSFRRDGDGFHRAIPGTIYLLFICTLRYKSQKWKRIIFAFRVNLTLIVSCFSLLNFVSRRSVENSAVGIHSWDAQIGNFISQHRKEVKIIYSCITRSSISKDVLLKNNLL